MGAELLTAAEVPALTATAMPAALKRSLAWLDRGITALITALLVVDASLMAIAIASRALLNIPITWVYELSSILLIAITFLGAVSAFHRNEHVGMRAIVERWPAGWRPVIDALANTMVFVFAAVGVWQTAEVLGSTPGSMPLSGLPGACLYVPVLLGLGLIGSLAAVRVLRSPLRVQLVTLLVLGAVTAGTLAAFAPIVALADRAPMLIAAVVFVACMAVGLPLAFDFGLTALVLMVLHPGMVLSTLALQMVGGVNSFVLMAVPFFVLTGGLLTAGGIAARLLRFLDDMTGAWRGGSAMAAVAGMYLFSGLSGAKIADVAAVGPVVAPTMRAKGYSDSELVAILSASAAMGESVPPSLAILVLTAVTSVSTGALFLAGLVPAAAVGVCLLVLIFLRARAMGVRRRGGRPPLRDVLGHLAQAIVPAGMPLIIFGGIIFGVATPIEASALAVIYGAVLSILVYRVSLRELAPIAATASRLSAMLLFLLAATSAFVWVITAVGVADQLKEATVIFAGNRIAFMLATLALLIVTGSVFEGLPAIVIFGPMLLPIAISMGINPLQYSVIIVMAMGVGNFLPPFGIGYFATCSIVGTQPERPVRLTFMYMAAALVGILIIATVPIITTLLPHVVGVRGG